MGDQPQAIAELVEGINLGRRHQVLLGATGTGKTFTMANIIQQVQKPALVMAHNKTLAAQLYAEFKEFFPNNAVEYFVSYYDYYQPEAYVPRHDLYIEKETDTNEEIDRLRLAATAYGKYIITLKTGEITRRNALLRSLLESHYERHDMDFKPGSFRVRGDTLDIYPAYERTGGLNPDYTEDGVHLKDDAFGPWAEVLRPYLEP